MQEWRDEGNEGFKREGMQGEGMQKRREGG